MKTFYRVGATVFAAIAGLAAIGAGVLFVLAAAFIGALVAVAAKLAITGLQGEADPQKAEPVTV